MAQVTGIGGVFFLSHVLRTHVLRTRFFRARFFRAHDPKGNRAHDPKGNPVELWQPPAP